MGTECTSKGKEAKCLHEVFHNNVLNYLKGIALDAVHSLSTTN